MATRSSKGATPATIKRHANAVLGDAFPIVQTAGKRVVWFLKDGRRIPFSAAEDLFNGCFDAVAVKAGEPLHLIQWSSVGGVSARRRKIERNFLAHLYPDMTQQNKARASAAWWCAVWGFEVKKGFRLWVFDWQAWRWVNPKGYIRSPIWKTEGVGIVLPPHSFNYHEDI